MSAQVAHTLRQARELIADPERWTTSRLARTAQGLPVDPCSPNAVRWCAMGAVLRVARTGQARSSADGALCSACAPGGHRLLDDINDIDGHAAVLALFDRAIRAEETEAMTQARQSYAETLQTVQLHWGGLGDCRTHDNLVHLGDPLSPHLLLCGHELFGRDAPGFSRGGGISGPNIPEKPCPGCLTVASVSFAGARITGAVGACTMADALGVEVSR